MANYHNPWREAPSIPSASPWDQPVGRQALRMGQTIVASLIGAGCVFMGAAVWIRPQVATPMADGFVLTYTVMGAALTMLAARALIPALVDRQALRAIRAGTFRAPRPTHNATEMDQYIHETGDAGRLCLQYLQHSIIASALVEGPVFFLLVVYLLEGAPVAMAMGAVMLTLLAAHFPTRIHAERWVEGRLDALNTPPAWGG